MKAAYQAQRYRPGRDRALHLSLWSSPGLSAWAVHDVADGGCLALFAAPGDLPQGDRLPRHPASVSFIVVPEISTLVPEGVLQDGGEAAHLELVHGPLPTGKLRDTPIDALSARCIFQHDEGVEHALLLRFPSARPIALQALLIKAALKRTTDAPTLLLHRGEQRCDLVIARDGEVLLSNSFHAPTATDLLYFALFALDRTGLKPGGVRLIVGGMGMIPEEGALLERYFPDVSPAVARNDRELAGLGVEAPEHWLAVLEQRSCVS